MQTEPLPEFLIRAVNAHEELLAALKALEATVSQIAAEGYIVEPDENKAARAVIAKAKGRA